MTLIEAARAALAYIEETPAKLWPAGTLHRITINLRTALAAAERTPGENARAHADRICDRAAAEAQPAGEPVAWTPVNERMPKSGQVVLACYTNAAGKVRRIRAEWVAAKSREGCFESDIGVYDEATDTYYDPEGWYERIDNWDDYNAVTVTQGEITHWMPLPAAPGEVASPAAPAQVPQPLTADADDAWLTEAMHLSHECALAFSELENNPDEDCLPAWNAAKRKLHKHLAAHAIERAVRGDQP